MKSKDMAYRSLSVAAGILGLFLSSCSEEATDKELNSTAKNALGQVKDWSYGKQSIEHAKAIVAFGPRPAESQELEKTRQYIQAELEKRGWAVQRQPFITNTPRGKMQFVNLYARYQGKSDLTAVWQRKHRGVVGAHIDSKKIPGIEYLGAADAAGSVGMLIELADLLGKYFPKEADRVELVFFDGEEAIETNILYGGNGQQDGLYGSHYYALHRNRVRKFGVILDLLGIEGQIVKMPSDSPDRMYKKVRSIAKEQGVGELFMKRQGMIIDDHVPLTDFGCPTIDIIGDFSSNSSWWHNAGDTVEILSEKQLGMNLKVVLELVVAELKR